MAEKLLLSALQGKKVERIPFWFMRQAGRYLPEYRELRKTARNFMDFCYTPDKATEATLQPIKRFGMDGAIIFSDILVVPHALGVDVQFVEGEGPKLEPVQNEKALSALSMDNLDAHLKPVYEALQKTKALMPKETTLIGFAGAPWTLACYVVEGKSSDGYVKVKALAAQDEAFFSSLIWLLSKAVVRHVENQVKAGAEVIQLFDSWAGVLSDAEFEKWVVTPTKWIVSEIKRLCPGVPVIGFPRQSGSKFKHYVQEVGTDAVSFDNSVPLDWVRSQLQPLCTVQGNLDNQLLAGDKKAMLEEAKKIVMALGDKAFVFNLGHGILPHTPLENMQALCDFLKNSN